MDLEQAKSAFRPTYFQYLVLKALAMLLQLQLVNHPNGNDISKMITKLDEVTW